MDDEPPEAAAHGGQAENGSPSSAQQQQQQQDGEERAEVVVIAARGAVVLDVLFDGLPPLASVAGTAPLAHGRRRRLVVPFRVDAAALVKHSRYFANLLDNTRFQEARAVKSALEKLAREGVDPADEPADAGSRLPRVSIEVACESRAAGAASGAAATRTATTATARIRVAGAGKSRAAKPPVMRRDQIFAELLRVLHWDGIGSSRGSGDDRAPEPATPLPLLPKTPAKKTQRAPKKGVVADTAIRSPKPSPSSPKVAWSEPEVTPFLPGSRWSTKTPPTLAELAELAMLADRFACTGAVAAFVRMPGVRLPQGGARGAAIVENEEFLRQKVYVAWLLDQPLWFHTATRALVLSGSSRWASSSDDADGGGGGGGGGGVEAMAPWWDLPDGLELELQFRRQCIVDCIASVPRHFLTRYARRNGGNGPQKDDNAGSGQGQRRYRLQCTMGYESSAACDSFQLGEMVKFLMTRGLLSFQDFSWSTSPSFSPPSATSFAYTGDMHHLLTTLRQCPAYQLDKHHVNCGLRPRLLPVLEFLQGMLAAQAIGLHRHEWALPGHGEASWLAAAEAAPTDSGEDEDSTDDDADAYDGIPRGYGNYGRVPVFRKPRPPGAAERNRGFRFTRSVAGDQRLRMAGTLGADKMARQLFTARKWNWTPET